MSKSLVLKVVSPEMKSYGGFEWPGVGGKVTAPDWTPSPYCGNGLHGWLNGVGDVSCQSFNLQHSAVWLVLSVDTDKIIDLGRKVKFPEAEVLFTGSMIDAARFIAEETGFIGPIIGIHRTGGNYATLTGGDDSTLTGGNYATLTGGNYATLTGGDDSTLTGGDDSTLTGGDDSTLIGGRGSTLIGGNYATLTGGCGSTLIGGDESILQLTCYDTRMRIATAYVGEDGIKPNVPYKLDENHNFVEVKDA